MLQLVFHFSSICRVPTAPGKPWKPEKMTVTFPVKEISWKSKILKNIMEKSEETWKMRISVIVNTLFSF